MGLCVTPQMAIITEFCDLGSLSRLIRSKSALSQSMGRVNIDTKLKLKLLKETALGLFYLHKMNITHFDIKGDNILVSDNLTAKVTDFGLALLKNESYEHGIGTPQVLFLSLWNSKHH